MESKEGSKFLFFVRLYRKIASRFPDALQQPAVAASLLID
jgi:hypothetical protein